MKTFKYHVASRTMLGDLHTPVSTYLKLRDLVSTECPDGKFGPACCRE